MRIHRSVKINQALYSLQCRDIYTGTSISLYSSTGYMLASWKTEQDINNIVPQSDKIQAWAENLVSFLLKHKLAA